MKRILLYFFFLVVSIFSLHSQTVKQLESERKNTLKQIETTNKMLNETKKTKQTSLNKLNILNTTIRERQSLIKTMNEEVKGLDSEMGTLRNERREQEKRLEILKADYAMLVQEQYYNQGGYNKMMFIFSAETLDQSYRRLRYLQEYSDHRKNQVKEIQKTVQDIEEKTKTLEEHRKTKMTVLQQKETETKKLSKDQETQKKMVSDLQKKEKDLHAELKKQQKKADQLNKKIEEKIAEEIKKSEAKKKKQQPATKPQQGKTAPAVETLTKEEQLLAGNFEKNKGRMPWPVERGFISGKYGVQPHAVLKYVTTNNKGIYIQTPANSDVRAIFDGEVTQLFSIPGSNNAVIVKHGSYRTVYANLTEIYVKEGDKVKPKQKLGKIYTDDEDDNKTELYFQLRKDKTILNPEQWITK